MYNVGKILKKRNGVSICLCFSIKSDTMWRVLTQELFEGRQIPANPKGIEILCEFLPIFQKTIFAVLSKMCGPEMIMWCSTSVDVGLADFVKFVMSLNSWRISSKPSEDFKLLSLMSLQALQAMTEVRRVVLWSTSCDIGSTKIFAGLWIVSKPPQVLDRNVDGIIE